ncbi:carbohydrate ABC transporter substrate-binding protein, CUT1 family (TC 3.A.1.1.-) [Stackebrandtia albiflava]|uniref:Carbohydrate ABC transporter substrate-binding protein, CUT1 family (TC 3.A.1.1.-) n=1 Tax=Stackebrandtia albiflava TaxID=406432 RepID=A0A562VBS3_9ACTN|nr:extracellular solute-binding protein [Stackebrandtia albiflava]TWJ15335.1 carbohydrate ABC transporter substrate-binding protein, CUT1 family (TC 3.A.1.1.-) [Stackebrandtia albiflava]
MRGSIRPGASSRRARTFTLVTGLSMVSVLAAGCLGGGGEESAGDPDRNADATEFTLTITSNAIKGGKNSEGATWIEDYVIPEFERIQAEKGVTANVEFAPVGVDDADYKSSLGLDLETGKGADIIDIDGIWVGEFAESGFIAPLDDVVGVEAVSAWDGWGQIQESVQQNASYNGERYGVPTGTDGRVIFYNKDVFEAAGLPTDWQPTSWQEILEAAETIKAESPDVIPLQLNAGTAMGEATTMQGFLPLLAGAGAEIHADDKWQGDTEAVRQVLEVYETVYGTGLGDPTLQQEAKGRDRSFQLFAEGEVGMLLESDYFWRSVVNPDQGVAPMENRDEVVGYAKIPAVTPGAGVGGQDFVSMSGGSARVINPNTEYPQQAWELLQFMNSAEATKEQVAGSPRITHRDDVNAEVLSGDPMLTFIAEEVVPLTLFRPGRLEYVDVSIAVQEATYAVVEGATAAEAAQQYQAALEDVVDAGAIATG